ncbi:DNA repair protein RAD50 [Babesia sp. Xinjiang]|uniref:DNA repair protein RAD50 n=1 Tax=Babesia sp. Xinjiang TaxID=462227 RepID=UPI000A22B018|nr:DNA repair protein RAD50 [Babesia sp. Xinjiang]ORM41773.1 DNA repair protein RAD50 [Babesia sp. Xinjiang]
MSTLHSLEIQGIRCFSPNNTQKIQFEKPLTLIVGPNGAGKTTIVECLKMGLSGILPPNSDRGKSFVHDCKLSQEREVRAQITLAVETYKKEMVYATRKYSITRDKNIPNKATFKAGETIMTVKPPVGEQRTVSMKCSDMDSSMPAMMGLSKAIIDSVILCHQDESNWALDDIAKVKAKFDDLLETSRYTKALSALNKAKREQDEAVKRETAKLQLAKAQVVQVADLKKQLSTNHDAISKAKANIAELETELIKLNETSKALREEQEATLTTFKEIRRTNEIIERLTKEINAMHQNMPEIYNDGLEDMHHYREQLTKELEISDEAYNKAVQNVETLMDRMNEIHQKLNITNAQMSNCMLIAETIKATTEALESAKMDIMREMKLQDDSQFNEDTVLIYVEQLENVQNDNPNNELLNAHKDEMAALENNILELTTKEGAQDVLTEAIETEKQDIKQRMRSLEIMQATRKQKDVAKQRAIEELSQGQQRLQSLLKERERLSILVKKQKNSINVVDVADTQELQCAIKFLEAVINNDIHQIVQYVKQVIGTDVDEYNLGTKLREFFATYMNKEAALDGYLIANNMRNEEQFQQDCVTAIVQMINHAQDWKMEHHDDLRQHNSNIEPYNPLLKLVTTIRISEYIAYYKTLLKPYMPKDLDSHVSCDEIKEQLDSVDTEIISIESRITHCKALVSQFDTEIMQIDFNIQKNGDLDAKYADMVSKGKKSEEEIQSIRNALEQYKLQLKLKREEYENLSAQVSAINKANVIKAAKLTSLVERYRLNKEKLEKAKHELETSTTRDNDTTDLQMELKTLNETINASRVEQRGLLQNLNSQRTLLDSLEKNITLKMAQQELQEARILLNTLQEKVGSRTDEDVAARIRKTNENCGRLSVEIATLRGSVITREENIAKLQQLIHSGSYKNVHRNYSDILLALKSHNLAREDLEIYTKKLEINLHKFHSEKIAQINTVLKRVWREVYTGNNVDYIEIQSNVDGVVPSTGLAPKSYNYRMVMVTHNGVEMDMRGRCSAGERVLASLILRITLSESFCSNCNILALDEPTTNLDRDNIASLEASLAKLVNDCSIDFQLVIITHDEPFARKMALKCSCEKYYKITKNAKNESVISAVPFSSGSLT